MLTSLKWVLILWSLLITQYKFLKEITKQDRILLKKFNRWHHVCRWKDVYKNHKLVPDTPIIITFSKTTPKSLYYYHNYLPVTGVGLAPGLGVTLGVHSIRLVGLGSDHGDGTTCCWEKNWNNKMGYQIFSSHKALKWNGTGLTQLYSVSLSPGSDVSMQTQLRSMCLHSFVFWVCMGRCAPFHFLQISVLPYVTARRWQDGV